MKRYLSMLAALAILTGALAGCNGTQQAETLNFKYDFSQGDNGWSHGVSDYTPGMDIGFEAGLRPLPDELEETGQGYYLESMNASDDLFMYLKKGLGTGEGVVPGTEYRVYYRIVFASDAPTGAVGIGGAPGEAVYLKAGAAGQEPKTVLDTAGDYFTLNVDKDMGNSGSGEAASIVGDIANGIPAEEFDFANPTYVSIEREHEHEFTVTAGEDGELWLLVGTDSGFEGLTGIFYLEIEVTLEPAS